MSQAALSPRFDLPVIEAESQAFWDELKKGNLTIAKCNSCKKVHYYPRPFCIHCWSDDVSLVPATGRGVLYTYSIVYMNDMPPFKDKLPYVAAVVDLEEGVRVSTNIVNCEFDDLQVGMPVNVVYQEVTDDLTIPVFEPV